jgi:hypothetical protein
MLSQDEFETLRRKLEKMFGEHVLDRRIRTLRVNSGYHWQPPLYIEVGKHCANLTPDGPPEEIVAIFESRSFLVCTLDHGVENGSPFIFTRADVKQVIYVEPPDRIAGQSQDESRDE